MKTKTRSFYATDENGKQYEIFEVTPRIRVSYHGTEDDYLDDLPFFQLRDGKKLNKISETEFQIVQTEKMLHTLADEH